MVFWPLFSAPSPVNAREDKKASLLVGDIHGELVIGSILLASKWMPAMAISLQNDADL